jgi:hypothetical protein
MRSLLGLILLNFVEIRDLLDVRNSCSNLINSMSIQN